MGQRLNIELFKKIRNRIATTPESYNQNTWCSPSRTAPCGTVACLAGETIICAEPSVAKGVKRLTAMKTRSEEENEDRSIADEAACLLGLNGLFSDEGMRLGDNESSIFIADAEYWPEPYRTQFQNADSRAIEAEVAVAYLDHIIETGKILE